MICLMKSIMELNMLTDSIFTWTDDNVLFDYLAPMEVLHHAVQYANIINTN